MTTSTPEITVARRNHWWNEDRETITTCFRTTWRGDSVTVEVTSDRYRTSDGNLTDWRHFVSAGWYGDEDSKFSSRSITDTARSRLRDVVLPQVVFYTQTKEYEESKADAIVSEMRSQVARMDSVYQCGRMIQKIQTHVKDAGRREKLVEAVNTYERFQMLLGEIR